MKQTPTKLELLAPARNADVAIQAILAGADAVYIGPASHGARKSAANSLAEIERVVKFAHPFRVKVYATVNTIVYDAELESVERLIWDLYNIGVDAVIIQDMGILRMNLPPIELHASTQCDIRTPEKAKFLHEVGMARVVPARELSLSEIAAIHKETPVEIEAFIHGALCVSYSGDCRASCASGGRSANRGECAQICRLPYDLTDADGNTLMSGKHFLSLRDLNRSNSIGEMADAGVTSFKIEGRLKDAAYVKNVTAHYSKILDRIVKESDGRYERASAGRSRVSFTANPDKAFNRGFTSYFLTGKAPARGLANFDSPKAIGAKVGTVTACTPKCITVKLTEALANGDGLGYFDKSGRFVGFRLNRIEGNRLFPASAQVIPSGTALYRNRDKAWDDEIESSSSERTLRVEMVLRTVGDSIVALDLTDERGCAVTATATLPTPLAPAVTPQEEPRRNILRKLGGTIYRPGQIIDLVGQLFVPASLLASLRREAIELLDAAAAATYHTGRRRAEVISTPLPMGEHLTMRDNVANRLAREFYADHGAKEIESAMEVERPDGDALVMCTRYCLRKELGKCLLTPEGRKWPSPALASAPLYLVNPTTTLRVEFDCKRCGMNIYSKVK